jgi:hypothetical protein
MAFEFPANYRIVRTVAAENRRDRLAALIGPAKAGEFVDPLVTRADDVFRRGIGGRAEALADPLRSAAGKIGAQSALADGLLPDLAAFERADATLARQRADLVANLTTLALPALDDTERALEREIRDRLLALPAQERERVVFSAWQAGDWQTVAAARRGPASFPVTSPEFWDRLRVAQLDRANSPELRALDEKAAIVATLAESVSNLIVELRGGPSVETGIAPGPRPEPVRS